MAKKKQTLKDNFFLYVSIVSFLLFSVVLFYEYQVSKVTYDNEIVPVEEIVVEEEKKEVPKPIEVEEHYAIQHSDVVHIEIKNKGVSQEVIPVGVDENNVMIIPNNARDLVWYARKGEKVRNIIIAGHRGWRGYEGTLFNSKHWEKGTELELTFDNGEKEVFVLTHKYKYSPEEIPEYLMNTEVGTYRVTIFTCNDDGTERVFNVFSYKG